MKNSFLVGWLLLEEAGERKRKGQILEEMESWERLLNPEHCQPSERVLKKRKPEAWDWCAESPQLAPQCSEKNINKE